MITLKQFRSGISFKIKGSSRIYKKTGMSIISIRKQEDLGLIFNDHEDYFTVNTTLFNREIYSVILFKNCEQC